MLQWAANIKIARKPSFIYIDRCSQTSHVFHQELIIERFFLDFTLWRILHVKLSLLSKIGRMLQSCRHANLKLISPFSTRPLNIRLVQTHWTIANEHLFRYHFQLEQTKATNKLRLRRTWTKYKLATGKQVNTQLVYNLSKHTKLKALLVPSRYVNTLYQTVYTHVAKCDIITLHGKIIMVNFSESFPHILCQPWQP